MVRTPFDRDAVLDFMRKRMCGDDALLGIEHAKQVAADTAKLAAGYFVATRGPGFDPARCEKPEVLEYAGLLHEMISHHGCSYDDLVGITNSDVADVVAALTPDMRLAEPKRVLDYRGVLSGLPPGLTVLVLCDAANHVADMFGDGQLEHQDDATLALFALRADRMIEDLAVLRYARSGMLGEYRRSILETIIDGRARVAKRLRASSIRTAVTRNIRRRKELDHG